MPDNSKKDQGAYSAVNPDEERDLGAKGGPTTGVGIPNDAHGISHPYNEDIQTQLAAKSTENKKDADNMDEDWKTGQVDDAKIRNLKQ